MNNDAFPRHLDPIAPVYMYGTHVTPDFLRMIRNTYGIHRFALFGPNASIPMEHFPVMEDFENAAARLNDVKRALADTDIEINWWLHPVIKIGLNSPHQHIVNYDGTVSTHGLCPLDSNARHEVASHIARVAELTHVPLIMIEDDYELSNHPGVTFGCFCPLHLAALEEKTGRKYSREELVRLFQEDRRETLPVRKAFADVCRDSLVFLATEIRQKVDKVSPQTRIGLCEPGSTDLDGYLTEDISRAFAGPDTRPLIRVCGTEYYCLDTPYYLPKTMGHTLYTAERLPASFEWMHESDTCPGTSFFMSAAFLETEIHTSLMMGAECNYFYGIQGADEDDFNHLEMYVRNARRFDALLQATHPQEGHLDGVRIVHSPLAVSAKRLLKNNATNFRSICGIMGRLGIPYSTKYGSPAILVGQEADVIPDDELLELLKQGLFVDVVAADILEQRGYGEYIGVHIQKEKSYALNAEQMADDIPEFAHIPRRRIPNGIYDTVCAADHLSLANPIPLPGAEILTWYCQDNKRIQAGMVRFANRLGGRVCVIANTLSNNYSSNIIRYTKQKILRAVFEWLRGEQLPAAAEGSNCWLLVRHTPQGTLFSITALGADGRCDVQVHMAESYRKALFQELGEDGIWRDADTEQQSQDIVVFKGFFPNMHSRIFRTKG